MEAQKCPVCDGSGKYKDKTCHGCDGKGWVEVGVDYPPPLPYNPFPHRDDPWRPYKPWDVYPYTWITWYKRGE